MTTPADGTRSGSACGATTWVALSLLAALVCASWTTVSFLGHLAVSDPAGRDLLYVWHGRQSDWWKGPALGLALLSSLTLLAWLLLRVLRILSGFQRTVATVIALTLWLTVAAAAVVIGGIAMLWVGGTATTVHGPGGVTRVVTQDGFDGDVVLVYRPVSRFTYLRESGEEGSITLDPRRGSCSIHGQPPARELVLSCGDTSYPLQ